MAVVAEMTAVRRGVPLGGALADWSGVQRPPASVEA